MTADAARRVAGYFAAPDDSTDTDLLGRFVADRDGQAFAALVRRHGPMVFGVCRRVTGDWHLAEDAFQASFAVLARKAATVSPPGTVAGWLHGVANRVARDARRAARRRFHRERPVDDFPDPPVQQAAEPDHEFRGVLDDELRKLPGKYRELLVACDLEGRPRQPVAEGLGIPEGTLSSRLTAARKMLASRLSRRGIAPAVAAAVAAGGPSAAAREVPRALLASAARIGSAAPGTVPAGVATLATGAIRAMTVRTYLPWAAGLLVAASATLGYAMASDPGVDTPGSPNPAPPKPALTLVATNEPVQAKTEPKPLPPSPNRMLIYRSGILVLIDPDGKNEKPVTAERERDHYHPYGVRLSPDGKQLAVLVAGPLPPDDGTREAKPRAMTLHVRGVDEKEPGTSLGVECRTFAWSPDGTEIACTEVGDGPREKGLPPATHYTLNAKTKAKTKLDLPADHVITDWSRDGKFLVTTSIKVGKDGLTAGVHLFTRTGTEHKKVIDSQPFSPFGPFGRLSPDGKQMLYLTAIPNKEGTPKDAKPRQELTITDVATGKTMKVEDLPLNGEVLAYCWSPDGKKIAYTWREVRADEVESHLIVCDPDGKNQKTITTMKERNLPIAFGQVDWR